ncbi:MAG: aspartate/glutamate racemase family protein [Nitrospirae bacterium]|nr:MAG: aspartate/glutamate racemase family protein [Nitrospirota bacterium]
MKIGIIGGMGSAASVRFYDMLIKKFQERGAVEDFEFPEIILFNLASKGLNAEGIKDEKIIKKDILKAIQCLNMCEIEKIIIVCNSVYVYLDYFQKFSDANILNMPKLAMDECGFFDFGVVCSRTTEKYGIFSKSKFHCSEKDQSTIDYIIARIISGKSTIDDMLLLEEIIIAMQMQGAKKVILGCTELPIILKRRLADIVDPCESVIRDILK